MPTHRVAIVYSYPPLEVMRQALQQTTTKRKKQNKTRMSTRNKNKTENRQNYQAGSPLPRQRSTFRKNRNERKECQQNKKSRSKKTTFKAAAAVCGAGILGRCPLVGLVPCYPVCHLLPALVNRGFPATVTTPPSCSLGDHPQWMRGDPAQCRLNLMPLSHEAFCCFEDPAIPLARLLSCNCPHLSVHSKKQLGAFRGPLVGIERFEVK